MTTGTENDYVSVTGYDNRIDAGSSTTFNEIHGVSGGDVFVLDPGLGYDKIFGDRQRPREAHRISAFGARPRQPLDEGPE